MKKLKGHLLNVSPVGVLPSLALSPPSSPGTLQGLNVNPVVEQELTVDIIQLFTGLHVE